jgi:serine/threonine protein kinase
VKRTAENNPIGKIPTAYIPAEHYSGPLSSNDPSSRQVFAFGMILFEVLAGKPPYYGLEPVAIRDEILAGTRPTLPDNLPACYDSLVKLFLDCTQRHLKDRLTLSQLCVTVLNLRS